MDGNVIYSIAFKDYVILNNNISYSIYHKDDLLRKNIKDFDGINECFQFIENKEQKLEEIGSF